MLSTFYPGELARSNQLQEIFLNILLQITLVFMQNSSPFDLVTEFSSSTWPNTIYPVRTRVYETMRAFFYYIVFDNIHPDSQINPPACLAAIITFQVYIAVNLRSMYLHYTGVLLFCSSLIFRSLYRN